MNATVSMSDNLFVSNQGANGPGAVLFLQISGSINSTRDAYLVRACYTQHDVLLSNHCETGVHGVH